MTFTIFIELPEGSEVLGVAVLSRQVVLGRLQDVLQVDACVGQPFEAEEVLRRVRQLVAKAMLEEAAPATGPTRRKETVH